MSYWTSMARRCAHILLAHAHDAGVNLDQVEVHADGTISFDGYTFSWNVTDQCVDAIQTPTYAVHYVA